MPLVRIEIVKGKTDEYKKQLMDSVHYALEDALGIPDWDRYQRLYELDRTDFEYLSDNSDRFTIIEITMFPGRTAEQKAEIFARITERLKNAPGIEPADVFIILHEPSDENWGLGGRQRK